MQGSFFPAAAMIGGLLLIVAGYVSTYVTPVKAIWSDEQAQEYAANAAAFHSANYAGHDHSKGDQHVAADRDSPEYLAAKAAFEKSKAARDQVLARQVWIQYGLIFAGVAFAGLGVVLEGVSKMRDEESPRRRDH